MKIGPIQAIRGNHTSFNSELASIELSSLLYKKGILGNIYASFIYITGDEKSNVLHISYTCGYKRRIILNPLFKYI
jgi:hypothetical protein